MEQPGNSIGDFGVLYELETRCGEVVIPLHIIRPTYYMSAWAESLPSVQRKGELMSFYPADLKMPMVAPKDIGELAAHLMVDPNTPKINSIVGHAMYSANDVAEVFSKALGKNVKVKVVQKDRWKARYKSIGFSEEGAESYTNMTEISLNAFEKTPDTTGFIRKSCTTRIRKQFD